MKNFKFLTIMFAAMALFAACNDDKEGEEPEPKPKDAGFYGRLEVEMKDGVFSMDNVKVDLSFDKEGTAELVMYKVKFADGMPMTIDMTISGLKVETKSETPGSTSYSITGDGILPTYDNGKPFESRILTDFEGSLVDDKFTFTMKSGGDPIRYAGSYEEGTGGGEIPAGKEVLFSGDLSVRSGAYVQEELSVGVILSEQGDEADLVLHGAKFAGAMEPQQIVVPGVKTVKTGDIYTISGDGIIPTVEGDPFEGFIITGLKGEFSVDALEFSMEAGGIPASYEGRALK